MEGEENKDNEQGDNSIVSENEADGSECGGPTGEGVARNLETLPPREAQVLFLGPKRSGLATLPYSNLLQVKTFEWYSFGMNRSEGDIQQGAVYLILSAVRLLEWESGSAVFQRIAQWVDTECDGMNGRQRGIGWTEAGSVVYIIALNKTWVEVSRYVRIHPDLVIHSCIDGILSTPSQPLLRRHSVSCNPLAGHRCYYKSLYKRNKLRCSLTGNTARPLLVVEVVSDQVQHSRVYRQATYVSWLFYQQIPLKSDLEASNVYLKIISIFAFEPSTNSSFAHDGGLHTFLAHPIVPLCLLEKFVALKQYTDAQTPAATPALACSKRNPGRPSFNSNVPISHLLISFATLHRATNPLSFVGYAFPSGLNSIPQAVTGMKVAWPGSPSTFNPRLATSATNDMNRHVRTKSCTWAPFPQSTRRRGRELSCTEHPEGGAGGAKDKDGEDVDSTGVAVLVTPESVGSDKSALSVSMASRLSCWSSRMHSQPHPVESSGDSSFDTAADDALDASTSTSPPQFSENDENNERAAPMIDGLNRVSPYGRAGKA
ncbi:hypothetical protein GYMLUDRAFT_247828 [Collybiopsis luxurians FD-317 M1]|uniref:Uncharacterized protein n=1 Tax=Collybiopsis luxurians FD-317 M1 TaxID=944289 RepID=A0A0D0CEV1_9AGAR|nr:hypothetical protein GYMLUDRAFT_247828 [Collybiopsis luxurians FD-317 M1]